MRHFALSTNLAITRCTSLPRLSPPPCNICCFCNLSALFTVHFVSYTRLIILHIDCILLFIVYCFLLVFFSLSLADEIKLLIISERDGRHDGRTYRFSLGLDEGTVVSVHLEVEAAGVAEVVAGTVASPQRRSGHSAVDTLTTVSRRR